MANGRIWTEEEKQLVIDNPGLPVRVLADKLGRTEIAVRNFQRRLRTGRSRGGKDYSSVELIFDLRPSGWYGETIGTLLTHFPDAFEAWKHYHRYVEVRVVSVDGSWTSLLCRRDADAP